MIWRLAYQLKDFELGQLGTTHVLSVLMTTRWDPSLLCGYLAANLAFDTV